MEPLLLWSLLGWGLCDSGVCEISRSPLQSPTAALVRISKTGDHPRTTVSAPALPICPSHDSCDQHYAPSIDESFASGLSAAVSLNNTGIKLKNPVSPALVLRHGRGVHKHYPDPKPLESAPFTTTSLRQPQLSTASTYVLLSSPGCSDHIREAARWYLRIPGWEPHFPPFPLEPFPSHLRCSIYIL